MAARLGEGLLYLDPAVFAIYRDTWLEAGHDPATVEAARLALGGSSWEREIP